MTSRPRRTMTWRTGVVFVIACMVLGGLVSVLVDRAQGQPAAPAHGQLRP